MEVNPKAVTQSRIKLYLQSPRSTGEVDIPHRLIQTPENVIHAFHQNNNIYKKNNMPSIYIFNK